MCFYCLTETKEAVDEKIKSKTVEFSPLSLCISAMEVNTESDLAREDVSLSLSITVKLNFLIC